MLETIIGGLAVFALMLLLYVTALLEDRKKRRGRD